MLMLRAQAGPACGSGLLLEDGLILTASHLTDALCPLGNCSRVEILSADGADQTPTPFDSALAYSLSIFRQFPALDITLLKLQGPPRRGLELFARKDGPALAEPVYAAGFPGCRSLSLSFGHISRLNQARLETSARGGRGSSGGILFDSSFRPLGVVIQAQNIADAIDSLITTGTFSLRAARTDLLESLINLPDQAALAWQARLLVEAYLAESTAASHLQMIAAQAGFVSGMQGLARTIRTSELKPAYQALPGLLYSAPSALLELPQPLPEDPDYFETEAAFALAALEANSLELSLIDLPDPHALRDALIASGRPVETTDRFFRRTLQILHNPLYGVRGLFVKVFRPVLLAGALLFLLWSWSLGFVYASHKGTLASRLALMLLVAVFFWPLSFLAFLLLQRRKLRAAALLLFFAQVVPLSDPVYAQQPLKRIAFGSCIQQDLPQPVWNSLNAASPDALLLLGDNVYAQGSGISGLAAAYTKLFAQPGFKKLRKNTQVYAIWDDNDYGMADGGADYPLKEQSRDVFLKFFPLPDDTRSRGPGLYFSRIIGPAGKRLQLIFLDTRYFRSPLVTGPAHLGSHATQYLPTTNSSATLLGKEQWTWLEEQLDKEADFRLLISSIQILATEHGGEKWANFPLERQKLFQLLARKRIPRLVILSGDRHYSEISRLDGVLPYALYDFTSSSMTMDSPATEIPNSLRLGPKITAASWGLLEIDWEAAQPGIKLAMLSARRPDELFNTRISFSSLEFPPPAIPSFQPRPGLSPESSL